jgi:hypothetical protein
MRGSRNNSGYSRCQKKWQISCGKTAEGHLGALSCKKLPPGPCKELYGDTMLLRITVSRRVVRHPRADPYGPHAISRLPEAGRLKPCTAGLRCASHCPSVVASTVHSPTPVTEPSPSALDGPTSIVPSARNRPPPLPQKTPYFRQTAPLCFASLQDEVGRFLKHTPPPIRQNL